MPVNSDVRPLEDVLLMLVRWLTPKAASFVKSGLVLGAVGGVMGIAFFGFKWLLGATEVGLAAVLSALVISRVATRSMPPALRAKAWNALSDEELSRLRPGGTIAFLSQIVGGALAFSILGCAAAFVILAVIRTYAQPSA